MGTSYDTGNYGPDEVVELIFSRPEPAEYLAKRLWQFFVSPEPSPADLSPIVAAIKNGNYELKPALRAIYPSLTGQFIMLTLTSSICSAVSAYELTSVAQRIESDTFRSFEVYFFVTFLYLAISWLLMSGFAIISHRFFSYPTR